MHGRRVRVATREPRALENFEHAAEDLESDSGRVRVPENPEYWRTWSMQRT